MRIHTMVNKSIKKITIIISVVILSACTSDPAVRLANCVEDATKKLKNESEERVKNTCDLSQEGKYAVVMYPNIILSDDELRNAGMDAATIATIRSLRFPHIPDIEPFESIYVIPKNKNSLPSRTTYYKRFATIPKLLYLEKEMKNISFTIYDAPTAIEITNIE